MTSAFNPYVQWLGLNIAGQPDCYTLIGLPWYEADPAKILAAADQAYARVQVQQAGINEATKQALLSEILTARACLLDPTSKATYDRQLQQYQQSTATAPIAQPMSAQAPMAVGGANPMGGDKTAASRARSKAKSGNKNFLVYGGIAVLLIGGIAGGGWYLSNQGEDVVVEKIPDDQPVVPVEKDPKEEPIKTDIEIPGNRPSAADLAGQVPGLGNPDEKMENIPDEPEMVAPVRPQPTAAQVTMLDQAIRQAWSLLGKRDAKAADVVLSPVSSLPKTLEGENELLRLTLLVEHLVTFDEALASGLKNFTGGEQLQVGSTQLTVVTNTADRLVVRLADQSKTYEKSKIPDGLARAIALKEMKEDDTTKKAIEGCFVMFSPLADPDHAEKIWTAGGVNSADYLALKADKFKYLGDSSVANVPMMQPMPNPMTDPGTTVPGALDSEKEKAVALGEFMQDVRKFLSERNIPAAKQSLAEATKLAELEAHKLKLDRLTQLVELTESFWQSVQNQLGELKVDEVLEVESTTTNETTFANVIGYTPEGLLLLRVAGENKRYTLADMPAGLAKYLAMRQMAEGDPNAKVVVGAFLLVEPEGNVAEVKSLWQESMLAGVDLQSLMPVIDDQYNLADDLLVLVEVPADTELTDVTVEFQKKWMQDFTDIKRASDRVDLANKLYEAGLEIDDGSKLQYVTFLYALAEAAKGGDFNLGSQVISDWNKRFKINPWMWQVKMAKLASDSPSSALHQALAAHLVSVAPSFIDANESETLIAILKIADESSKKSRDKDLMNSVQKLLDQNK
ncbi:MAG: hypothetical protein COA78_08185 [Blastopirellula sp.]|nr:MAG: hypothetical protein COA78_08185 [Blastopirellula sp.]